MLTRRVHEGAGGDVTVQVLQISGADKSPVAAPLRRMPTGADPQALADAVKRTVPEALVEVFTGPLDGPLERFEGEREEDEP
jgi:hypothetical protein